MSNNLPDKPVYKFQDNAKHAKRYTDKEKEDLVNELLETMIAENISQEEAFGRIGLNKSTFYEWIKKSDKLAMIVDKYQPWTNPTFKQMDNTVKKGLMELARGHVVETTTEYKDKEGNIKHITTVKKEHLPSVAALRELIKKSQHFTRKEQLMELLTNFMDFIAVFDEDDANVVRSYKSQFILHWVENYVSEYPID